MIFGVQFPASAESKFVFVLFLHEAEEFVTVNQHRFQTSICEYLELPWADAIARYSKPTACDILEFETEFRVRVPPNHGIVIVAYLLRFCLERVGTHERGEERIVLAQELGFRGNANCLNVSFAFDRPVLNRKRNQVGDLVLVICANSCGKVREKRAEFCATRVRRVGRQFATFRGEIAILRSNPDLRLKRRVLVRDKRTCSGLRSAMRLPSGDRLGDDPVQ